MHELIEHANHINELLARYGVKFGIYKNNQFKEQLFPFDAILRVIAHEEFERLEKGLKQRVQALNLFLKDIYSKKQIVKDGVIPEEFIFISSGYLAECEGAVPPKGIYSHISGIDLVKGKNEEWYILEDNLRVPSGASYPMIARELCRRCSPDTFQKTRLENNRNGYVPPILDIQYWGYISLWPISFLCYFASFAIAVSIFFCTCAMLSSLVMPPSTGSPTILPFRSMT